MARGPNILLITTDEERFNVPRPAGFSLPARERIAESGTTFTRYYAASTQCSSSRSVIYTGRHLPITQIYDNDNMPYVRPLDPGLGTLGTMLRSHRYYCTYQGKWHLSNAYVDPANPVSTVDALEPYGFSEWNDWGDIDGGAWAGLRVDPVIAGQAVKWLRERAPVVAAEQPWFMAVNFVNPHDIMSFDYGSPSPVQLPLGLAHAVKMKPPADVPVYRRSWDLDLPDNASDDLAGAAPAVREFAAMLDTVFGPVTSDEHWRAGLDFYLNCLRDVDRSIELVLDALEASGEGDRTIVVFTADHGEMAGSHRLRQKANLVYDENFHVPLVVHHPDVSGGGTTDALASAVDLAPTLLAFAGLDEAATATNFPALRGKSLVPALAGEPVRDGVLTAVETITTLDAGFWTEFSDPKAPERLVAGELRPDWHKRGFLRGYTDERYSFGRYFSPLEPNRPTDLTSLLAHNDVVLYDRREDPGEVVNLAVDPSRRDLVADYSAKLERLISAEVGDDMRIWVLERPQLLGWPTWRGDRAA
ncbi:MAG TPA: sulfatase-like hydrolase/transferase [Acidimicrobiia bacterium]|nr:sulfatase-like hydrolase/transferase [Acidimicrobiia bacterium]